MINCNKVWVNQDLYNELQNLANPCDQKDWLGKMKLIGKGTVGKVYEAPILIKGIPNLLNAYVIKIQPVNARTNNEKRIHTVISDDLLLGKAPLLFSFLYLAYVCGNELHLLMQPAGASMTKIITDAKGKVPKEWWIEMLYQLSKAVYYLEDKQINHNDLTFENIMFQNASLDYKSVALMLVDFGSAVQGIAAYGGLPPFVLGRDLNYFLYMLINYPDFPKEVADQLYPLIMWEKVTPISNEDPYMYGLRRANITKNNWKTSGKYLSRFLASKYPYVTDRCSAARLNKLYGTGIGAIIGDAFGMPIEFDYDHTKIIKKMYPSAAFDGLSAWAKLPAGTFTDDTQMAMALIDAIMSDDRSVVPSSIAREYKRWVDSGPIDVGKHTTQVFKIMKKDGSNWKKASYIVYNKKPNAAANGAVMRTWPIPILHHADPQSMAIDSAIKQAQVSHMNNDATFAAVFVTCLIHNLIGGAELNLAIEEALKVVKPFVSDQLYNVLKNGHKIKYADLNGGTGWVVNTMAVVMWSIRNTKSFADAIIRAANVNGDTDTNASITGAIAGALYGYNAIPKDWLAALDAKNKWNVWGGYQMTTALLKDRIATLAQC